MFSSSSGSVPAPGTLQVGIVSSQRLPPDPFNWMRYHVDVGISAFYIVFEETPDVPEGMAEYAAQLTAALGRRILFYWERRDVDRAREDNYMDLMTRQRQWVDRMVAKARSDGVAWLFHVDDDELLYPGDTSKDAISTWPEVLAAVPPSCASVHVDNWEAFSPESPASSWITDGGVRFLPQSCAGLFSAYGNGKGGTRTLAGQKSFGPHRFTGGKDCALAPTRRAECEVGGKEPPAPQGQPGQHPLHCGTGLHCRRSHRRRPAHGRHVGQVPFRHWRALPGVQHADAADASLSHLRHLISVRRPGRGRCGDHGNESPAPP